ncbi:hypothetical protein GUJ93_ZPchr0012g20802 [Zizania palustris]|uniref:Uncharacterized protein n=1 Tax=Zizania palustris TaxID=103762 RepID=A0A8J6BS87_ZIZPA|nr:hypothetical protein GUJ93_ZPchr0012g20802 [Zizania palustris]
MAGRWLVIFVLELPNKDVVSEVSIDMYIDVGGWLTTSHVSVTVTEDMDVRGMFGRESERSPRMLQLRLHSG